MAGEPKDSRGEARQSFFAKQQLLDAARTTFQQLSAVLKSAALYPEGHPFLVESAEKLLGTIDGLLAGQHETAFYLMGGELFFKALSVPLDQTLSQLMEQLGGRDIGGIIFKPGLTPSELIKFAGLMGKDTVLFPHGGDAAGILAEEQITHIVLHRGLHVSQQLSNALKEGNKKAVEIFGDAVAMVKEMVQAVHFDKAINMRRMNTTVQTMVDNVLDNRDAFLGLTSIKMYDEYTFSHSVNTSVLAVSLGSYLSFGKAQIAALGVAGLLHDIGKINVPLEVINKPGKLTDQEWEFVKRHPIEGALTLADVPGVTKLAMVAAFEHHRRHDISGYPRVDGMSRQHPFSQIVAIADSYDALTAMRVYYSARTPPDQAIRILFKQGGTTFDPVLIKAFANMIGIFPIGTVLKLDTGELGLVLHQTRDLLRPRVLLLKTFDGTEQEEVSLLDMGRGKYKRSPVATIEPSGLKIDLNKYLARAGA
ncbi:MAG TPA: HD-GYP domain-containing protein [Nitrospirota bacterium]